MLAQPMNQTLFKSSYKTNKDLCLNKLKYTADQNKKVWFWIYIRNHLRAYIQDIQM